MNARARYRARKPRPPQEAPRTGSRWVRRAVILVLLVGYAALMWYLVFPWFDRTFVNQPAV